MLLSIVVEVVVAELVLGLLLVWAEQMPANPNEISAIVVTVNVFIGSFPFGSSL